MFINIDYFQYIEAAGLDSETSTDSDNASDDAVVQNNNVENNENNENSENNQENDQEDNSQANEQTFYDISLPIEHSYLGSMDSIQSQRPLFAPGSIVQLKTLYLDGIFLFPGQKIPLSFLHRVNIEFIKKIIASESKIFGLRIGPVRDCFGTTAEILNFQEKDEIVTIKVQGRQRFKIIKDYTNSDSEYMPTVCFNHFGLN